MSSSRCIAKTQTGRRCKNRTSVGNGYFCSLHSKIISSPQSAKSTRKSTFEKVETAVKIAGGVTGTVAGLLKITEFAIAHWAWLIKLVESVRNYAGDETEEVRRKADEPTYPDRMKKKCEALLRGDSIARRDLQLVSLDFRLWFDNVPKEIQKGLVKEFGSHQIEVIRQHGFEALRNPAMD